MRGRLPVLALAEHLCRRKIRGGKGVTKQRNMLQKLQKLLMFFADLFAGPREGRGSAHASLGWAILYLYHVFFFFCQRSRTATLRPPSAASASTERLPATAPCFFLFFGFFVEKRASPGLEFAKKKRKNKAPLNKKKARLRGGPGCLKRAHVRQQLRSIRPRVRLPFFLFRLCFFCGGRCKGHAGVPARALERRARRRAR